MPHRHCSTSNQNASLTPIIKLQHYEEYINLAIKTIPGNSYFGSDFLIF